MRTWLLADDDRDDRDMFCEALAQVDPAFICHCVADGRELIDRLSGGEFGDPDILFLDINMPRLNGWECLSFLKKNDSLKKIPVIMYSTSAHRREKELAKELGAIGYFTKPTEFWTLKSIISFLAEQPLGSMPEDATFFETF